MTKVAVLYIATGKYTVFWPEFYESAEKYLLKDCEVHYFVFTDADDLTGAQEPRVHICPQEAYSWPFATLRRFEIFLKQEQALKAFDYIFFFNANAQLMQPVTQEMFLPRAEKGEKLLVVQHPSFYAKPNYEFTYDRNPRSTACIPYGMGRYYVCGGVNGGTAEAFLKLCHTLDARIRTDLHKNVIALWHDESQINRYILFRKDIRVLSPAFCYPEDWNHLPFPCIVLIRSKARYLDIPALRKDAPQTKLSPAAERWNRFAMRAARWTQNHIFKKGK